MAEIDGIGQYVFFVFSDGSGKDLGAVKRALQELLPMVSLGITQEEGCRLLSFSWVRELDQEKVKKALISLRVRYPGLEIRFSASATLTM